MRYQLFILPFFLVILSACSQQVPVAKDVSLEEFQKLIANPRATILDVRTPEEVSQGKIPHSVNIDYFDNFEMAVEKLNKTKPIYVYCAAGGRSTKAMQELNKMGFKQVYNLTRGFEAWHAAKLPVE